MTLCEMLAGRLSFEYDTEISGFEPMIIIVNRTIAYPSEHYLQIADVVIVECLIDSIAINWNVISSSLYVLRMYSNLSLKLELNFPMHSFK